MHEDDVNYNDSKEKCLINRKLPLLSERAMPEVHNRIKNPHNPCTRHFMARMAGGRKITG